jgi:hypothetical protein
MSLMMDEGKKKGHVMKAKLDNSISALSDPLCLPQLCIFLLIAAAGAAWLADSDNYYRRAVSKFFTVDVPLAISRLLLLSRPLFP